MSVPYVSAIYVYPVKSLGGICVEQWPVTERGLRYDRHWMVVDSACQFLTQRRLPRMVLIQTVLTDSHLICNAPGMTELAVGLTETTGEQLSVDVWQDNCQAQAVSPAADQWFSEFLQQPCRLVFQATTDRRHVDANYAQPTDQTAFSDGFPFLIIAQSSLQALNHYLPMAIEMARFRPNLVIANCAAYAEDTWREIQINSITFRLPKPCSRCVVPTLDPVSAEYTKEPLHTLSCLRKVDNKVYFGQNALHNQTGILSCNAHVTVLRTGKPQPAL